MHKQPDLRFLKSASRIAGVLLKAGDIVIYESTVYPGATEEICVPILERISELAFNWDFFVGYSPERINPGDKAHQLTIIEDNCGLYPRGCRFHRCPVSQHHLRRHPQGQQYPGCRGGQGHREHPARRQHRS